MKNSTLSIIALIAIIVNMAAAFAVTLAPNANGDLVCSVNGDSAGYEYAWYKNGQQVAVSQYQYMIGASMANKGTWTCEVSEYLGFDFGYDRLGSASVTVLNRAPTFTSAPVLTGTVGAAYAYDANANDFDLDVLTFGLTTAPAGMTINPTTGVISFVPAATGTYAVVVSVTDGIATGTQSYNLVVSTGTSGLTVTAIATPSTGVAPLTTQLSAAVSGGSGSYSYCWDLDANIATCEYVGQTATHVFNTANTYNVVVSVTDTVTTLVQTANVQVVVSTVGSTPLALTASGTPTSGNSPLTVSFSSSATGGAAPYTIQWDFTNDGTFDITSQNPSTIYNTAGAYIARANVTDSLGASAQVLIPITVSNVGSNVAPVFTTNPVLTVVNNTAYVYDANAFDANGNTLTFALVQGPIGMTINPTTGVVTFNPNKTGTPFVNISVTDGLLTTSQWYFLTVVAQSQNTQSNTNSTESPDEDDLLIDSIELLNSDVQQGTSIEADVTLENEGDIDFEDLVISMSIDELGVKESIAKFDLNDGKKTTKHLVLALPNQVTQGMYSVKFTIKSDDVNLVRYQDVFIYGQNVVPTAQVQPTTPVVSTDFGVQPSQSAAKTNWTAVWLMVALLLALFGVAGYLLFLVIKQRKETQTEITALDNEVI